MKASVAPGVKLASFTSDPSFWGKGPPLFIYVTQTNQLEDNKPTNPPAKQIL
jgi:hypothetical protein